MTDDEIDVLFIKELHNNNHLVPIVTNLEMVQRWERAGYEVITRYHWPLDKGCHYLSFYLANIETSKEELSGRSACQ